MKVSLETIVHILAGQAIDLGATAAGVVPVSTLSIEARLAAMCASPQCPSYGRTANCPPHVMPVSRFLEVIKNYSHAVVFKIDAPQTMLLTDERFPISRRIHEISAGIETEAIHTRGLNAFGLGAGSCKPLFCADHAECSALSDRSACRHPEKARPSMSGFGIHVFKLAESMGWPIQKITRQSRPDPDAMGLMAGLVLLGKPLLGPNCRR